jgi:hypothetical protein
MAVRLELRGFDQLSKGLKDISDNITDDVLRVVEEEANALLAESQEIVPVDTGFLRDSGYVEITRDGDEVTARIGYAAPYALTVHEHTDAHHDTGQAKFLEAPLLQRRSQFVGNVKQRVTARLLKRR